VIADLQPGVWQISVHGTSSAGDYRLDKRLVVRGMASSQ
jgi:hypothetical protein